MKRPRCFDPRTLWEPSLAMRWHGHRQMEVMSSFATDSPYTGHCGCLWLWLLSEDLEGVAQCCCWSRWGCSPSSYETGPARHGVQYQAEWTPSYEVHHSYQPTCKRRVSGRKQASPLVLPAANDARRAGIDAIRAWRAALEHVAANLPGMAVLTCFSRATLLQFPASAVGPRTEDGVVLGGVHPSGRVAFAVPPCWEACLVAVAAGGAGSWRQRDGQRRGESRIYRKAAAAAQQVMVFALSAHCETALASSIQAGAQRHPAPDEVSVDRPPFPRRACGAESKPCGVSFREP